MQATLLVISVVSSFLAICFVQYYAINSMHYVETKVNSIKTPYSSSRENNADIGKLKVVKEAMQHAWNGYETYAWGADELLPEDKSGKFGVLGSMDGFKGMGASIIDAMSTLKLMGMDEEFERAKGWVEANLTFDLPDRRVQDVSFFETTIRILGGLLSSYDLSGHHVLLEKAEDLGRRLCNAFGGVTSGLLLNEAQLPMTEKSSRSRHQLLAEVGSNLIEFATLGDRSGNDTYRRKAEAGMRFLHARHPDNPMIGTSVSRMTGLVTDRTLTVSAGVDSYYEYLLKYWILGGKLVRLIRGQRGGGGLFVNHEF